MDELPYLKKISLKRDRIESFHRYPFSIPAIRELDSLEFGKEVTFLVGENGSGKSTLLEAIAVALGFNPEGEPKISTSVLTTRILFCINISDCQNRS